MHALRRSRSSSSCSTTTTRRPTRRSSSATSEGRLIGTGKGAFELTGLKEEQIIGRPASEVLGLRFADGDDPVATVLEWGVRQLGKPV